MSDPRVRPLKPARPDLSSASTLGHGHPFAPRTGRCRKKIQIGPWDRATRAFAVVFSRNEGPTGPRRTQTARTGVRWQYQARHAKRAKKAAAPFSIARRARVDDRPEQDGAEQGRLRQRPGRQPAVRKAGPRRRAIPPRNARTRPPRSRRSWPRLVLRKGRGDSRAHPFVDLGARSVVVREKPRRRPCPPLASTTPRPEGGEGQDLHRAARRDGTAQAFRIPYGSWRLKPPIRRKVGGRGWSNRTKKWLQQMAPTTTRRRGGRRRASPSQRSRGQR